MSLGNSNNPYSAPVSVGASGHVDVRSMLQGPGIALVTVGTLGFLTLGCYFVLTLLGLMLFEGRQIEPPDGANEAERIGFMVGYIGSIGAMGVSTLLQLFVVWGGVNFLRQKGRGMALFACILSVIPCLSSCGLFGIPFGIWGLMVLNDPAVKRAMS